MASASSISASLLPSERKVDLSMPRPPTTRGCMPSLISSDCRRPAGVGDEVRYLITSPTPAGLRQSELISEGMQPLVVGGLGIERSTFLSLGKSEAEMEDALAIRDFVLRGTRPGSASVIVGDGHALSAILTDALCRHVTAPAASVSVLDFDTGSWPAAVADELPTAQLICFSFSPDG
eukprot:Transcript_20633.p3 GENE.Transcript_20633~~Transcript_20633.p3  ORF type:complete len:178 (-),score=41.77 Transcript_20633:69-602(-)